jgi:SAM-dependent methyltransferase
MPLDPWLREHLVCPRDHTALTEQGDALVCRNGHRYPCVGGIPIMVLGDVAQTHWAATYSLEHAHDEEPAPVPGDAIDPVVREALGATCGNLYLPAAAGMTHYPIPDFPLKPHGVGDVLLDVGCHWGRWCVSATHAGFQAVGLDPYLPAVRAARRVAAQLGVSPSFVVGDARYLPFRPAAFDAAFSYSVLQHFSPGDVRKAVNEIGRVLRVDGRAHIQMTNKFGVRNVMQQARRGFRTPRGFEVRYWNPADLVRVFEQRVGPARLDVDSYFSLNAQVSDLAFIPARYRPLVRASAWLRRASARRRSLVYLADSLYVHATRSRS